MAQTGNDIADNLKNTFSQVMSAPGEALQNAANKAKSFLGINPPSTVTSKKIDPTWHNDMVNKANDSFKSAPAKKTPEPVKKPSYEKGTDYVPKTGPAVLHKGEAVLNKEDAEKHREAKKMKKTYDVSDELGGKKEEKPKKEIKHMHIKKASNGGHIIRHEHTHPEHHPDEEHTTKTDDELADHVLQNMGTPNPGEEEVNSGQDMSQAAPQGAAPQAGAPAAGAPPMGA